MRIILSLILGMSLWGCSTAAPKGETSSEPKNVPDAVTKPATSSRRTPSSVPSRADYKKLCMSSLLMAHDSLVKGTEYAVCVPSKVKDLNVAPDYCEGWSGPYLEADIFERFSSLSDEEFQRFLSTACHLH